MPSPAGVYYAPALAGPQPARFGLLSVADVVTDSSAHWRNGVEVDGDPCVVVNFAGDPCAPDGPVKQSVDAYTSYTGEPFTVYLMNSCRTVGRMGDARERAERALERNETAAVEQAFLQEVLVPNAVDLGGIYPLVSGVAVLEGYLGAQYGGVGIIHGARSAITVAARPARLRREGDRIETFLGTPVAAGAGYEANLGPDGEVAPAGTAWLYATGAVRLTRSPIDSRPVVVDTVNNTFYALAERTYVPLVDCLVAAVQVQLPCCEDCGEAAA